MSARAASSCALAVAIFVARAAGAEPAVSTSGSHAERLFREGRVLMEAGDLAHACPKFAESEKLDPAPGTLLSLADCEEHQKALIKAREHYQLAASGFPKSDPRRAFAAGRAQALDKRIAHVTLRLPPDAPAETTVRIGEIIVARSDVGTSTLVDPGELKVNIHAPGRDDNTITVTLAEGESREVLCAVGAPSAPSANPFVIAPARDEQDDKRRLASTKPDARRTVAFVLLGVGAASLAVGGVTGILAVSKAHTVRDHCDASYACDQEGVDAASSGRLLSPLSTVTLIAGAALAGAGVYFFVASAGAKPPPTALLRALQGGGAF